MLACPQNSRKKESFRPDIQGLRAISVISVILFHLGSGIVSGGFLGVDIFFVISGFIITSLLLREQAATGTVNCISFLSRRARRLLPNASLVLIFVLIAGIYVVPNYDFDRLVGDVKAAALYYSNFHFLYEKLNYFSSKLSPSPVVHFWSLSIEEQFYFFWPILLIACGLAANRLSLNWKRLVGLTLTFIWLVSFVLCVMTVKHNQPQAFFSTPTRVWELATGALLALHQGRLSQHTMQRAQILGALGLLMIFLPIFLMSEKVAHPGMFTLIPVMGTVAVILAGCNPRTPSRATLLLSRPSLGTIGDHSYSLYLWHWPIIVFAQRLIENKILSGLLALFATLIFSSLAYRFVERPIHYGSWLRQNRMQQLLAAGAAVSLTLAAGFAATHISNLIQSRTSAYWTEALRVAHNDDGPPYRDKCHLDGPDIVQPDCLYGDKTATQTAILFGDSHAAHWFPALNRAGLEKGWAVRSWTKSICPGAKIRIWDPYRKTQYIECDEWRASIIARALAMNPKPVVFLSSSNGYGGWSQSNDGTTILIGRAADDNFEKGLVETAKALIAGGAKVFIIRDTPLAEVKYMDCIVSHLGGIGCERPRTKAVNQNEMEKRAAEKSGAGFIDTSDLFCDETKCPVVKNGMIVYRDDSHMTATFAETLAEPFKTALDSANHIVNQRETVD